MERKIKRFITIETDNGDDMRNIRDKIYCQLAGNRDFVNCNIVLNDSDDRRENNNEVHLIIYEECKNIPALTI